MSLSRYVTLLNGVREKKISEQIEAVREVVNGTEFTTRTNEAAELENQVSTWQKGDSLSKLVELLKVLAAFNSAHSGRSVRRLLQQMSVGSLCRASPELEQLEAIADILVAYYYLTPPYDDNLTELRDAVYLSKEIPFPQLARLAGRLLVPNKEGAPFVAPDEMASVVFSKARCGGAPIGSLREGIHQLINDHSVAVWERILPDFHFDRKSDREKIEGCTTFLQHCFDAYNPALLLVHDHDNNDILARVTDVRTPERPARKDFMETLEQHGVRGLSARMRVEDLEDQRNGDFFEHVAYARHNTRQWIERHCNTVLPFRRPR